MPNFSTFFRQENGSSLLEAVVALAIVATVIVTFFSGLIGTSKAAYSSDVLTTAESLAQSQMEWVRSANYTASATQYSPSPIPSGKDYVNYSVNITATPLNTPDDGIQKLTVIVSHFDEQVYQLESYKVNR